MPQVAVKLLPGVNENRTPALNEAGISASNLIRFQPDSQGIGLVQKLGGWIKFYSQQINSIVRALWAYQDSSSNQILAVGTENDLSVIIGYQPNGNRTEITPQVYAVDVPVSASTIAGSPLITINDAYSDVFSFDSVFIQTQLSVGGVVLFGLYPVALNAGAGSYEVEATDTLGFALNAVYNSTSTQYQVLGAFTATSSGTTATLTFSGPVTFSVGSQITVIGVVNPAFNGLFVVTASSSTTVSYVFAGSGTSSATQGAIIGGPTLPIFNTTNNSSAVTIYFPNHGLSVANSFTILTPTTVGGVTFQGDYIVENVLDANSFTINSVNLISATAQTTLNNNLAQFEYFIGQGQVPAASGYGVGGYGVGGYGTGAILSVGRTFTTTAASGTGTTATLSFAGNYYVAPGSIISITGLTPTGYNTSSATVLSCYPGSTTILTYASSAIGAQTVAGTITVVSWQTYPQIGTFATTAAAGTGPTSSPLATISFAGNVYIPSRLYATVSGVVPNAYNGIFPIVSTTTGGGSTTVTYQSTAFDPQTKAGTISIYGKALDWSLDNWGDILIASPQGGPIYQWYYLTGAALATVIPYAPVANNGVFVAMPQRQLIAWGSTETGVLDPLLVRWCDVENFNVWIALLTNQAGSYRIPRGSTIVGAIQGPQQALIWTDLAVWSMQYIGQPLIYSFNEIGTGCGMIARKAAISINGIVYWMGQSQFFSLSGNGITPIYCPIWDVVFQDLDTSNLNKIRVAGNSQFGEIAWYYPTISGGGENGAYVKYNIILNAWDFGTLSRTAWINQSIFGPPIGAGFQTGNSGAQFIYQHETSPDADGQPLNASFTTGLFAIADGDQKTFIDEVRPDFKWGTYDGLQSANINITLLGCDYAEQLEQGTQINYGPWPVTINTQWFNPRVRNRLCALQISSDDTGSFWRIGGLRYRSQNDGKY